MAKPVRVLLALAVLPCAAALAQTRVTDAWVRGTVTEQQATGLFALITSVQGGKLVAAASPVAGVVEVHEMRLDDGVMRMRAVPALDLPAGKAVELKPGGYHVMLLDLKQPLAAGDTVPVTLVVESNGKRESVAFTATVRAPGMAPHKP